MNPTFAEFTPAVSEPIFALRPDYFAISVRYAIPVGGENVAACAGAPRLVRASGVAAPPTKEFFH